MSWLDKLNDDPTRMGAYEYLYFHFEPVFAGCKIDTVISSSLHGLSHSPAILNDLMGFLISVRRTGRCGKMKEAWKDT